MNDQQVKLINIIESKFIIPDKTNGDDILMSFEAFMLEINIIWPQENNWTLLDLEEVISYLKIPWFMNFCQSKQFILKRI